MASSKKLRPATKPQSSGRNDLAIFVDAIQHALTRNFKVGTIPVVAVAYSGGADSTVLLHAVAALHQQQQLRAIALHVHHGLSTNADQWLQHCAETSVSLELPFFAERVKLNLSGGKSLEAEARQARYAALQGLCQTHGVLALLTAHHADDQAETVLLNLLRGAGIAGLAGAASQRAFGDLMLLRPFLEIGAAQIRQLVSEQAWSFIEDESNQDKRHTRNALRHEVMPVLKRIFPAVTTRLTQTAAHSAEAQALLDDIGREDLEQMQSRELDGNNELHIDGLRQLSRPRAANALRVWFRTRARQTPSTAALKEMLDQLLDSHNDAQISLIHDDLALQVYRGRVYARPTVEATAQQALTRPLIWQGESELVVPEWHGKLLFRADTAVGIPVPLLRSSQLTLRARHGGERIKLHPNRPSRSLKNLYQESGIPPWQRVQLPLLYAADQLIFAAGLGMAVAAQSQRVTSDRESAEDLIQIGWQAD